MQNKPIGRYYVNNNGREFKGDITESNFNKVVETLFRTPEELFPSAFLKFANEVPKIPFNTEDCSDRFPPSSKFIDEDKRIVIQVGLCGCDEKCIKELSVSDDIITLRIDNPVPNAIEDKTGKVYAQKGLKLPRKEILQWRFNPIFHDPNTLKYEFANGLLTITMDARESMKPVRKAIVGCFEEDEPSEEKAIEEETPSSDE